VNSPRRAPLFPVLRRLGQQDWLRVGLRNRVIGWVARPGGGSHVVEAPFFGMRYLADLNDLIDWSIYFHGAYEKPELTLLGELLADRPGAVAVDVGASAGQHTMFFSRLCAHVHAFEPYSPLRRRLDEHVQLNGLDNVTVHAVGIADTEGELDFYEPLAANVCEGSFARPFTRPVLGPPSLLPVVHGDAYLASLGLERLDLVKIDVEGFERNVLLGLRDTLREHRPLLLFEFTRYTKMTMRDAGELFELLPPDYEAWRIRKNRARAKLFNSADAVLEPFDFDVPDVEVNLLLRPA
jgi:FkbM family methyltransferase